MNLLKIVTLNYADYQYMMREADDVSVINVDCNCESDRLDDCTFDVTYYELEQVV